MFVVNILCTLFIKILAAKMEFPKIKTCVVVGPKNIHTKFGVDWCSDVSRIAETKV